MGVNAMFQKILVAIDDSKSSRIIFEEALMLAKANRSALMLMHVLNQVDDLYPGDTYIGIPESAVHIYANRWKVREQTGINHLQSLEAEATAAGIPTEFTQNVGDPGKSICEVAKTWNATLIAIGRRGLSGLSELFLGSTSNYVLHHAPCDVLIIQSSARTLPQHEIAIAAKGSA
jgi:nucleotide-binding universal stress UspA family protein